MGAGRAPPIQILSISCSFRENLAKLYVGAPPGELAPPPHGNPGSPTELCLRFGFTDVEKLLPNN